MGRPVRNDRINRLIEWQRFVLTEEGREEFLQRLVGSGDLDEVCREMDLPRGRVLAFVASHVELSEAARGILEMQAHVMATEALEIADEQKAAVKEDGSEYDPDVPRDRLRVDTRLKLIEKWNRKAYGKVVEHKHDVTVDLGERLRRAMERAAGRVLPAEVDALPPAPNWPVGQKVGEVPGVQDDRVVKISRVLDDMVDGVVPRVKRDERVL